MLIVSYGRLLSRASRICRVVYFFVAAEGPDMDELSKAEITSLDKSIAEYKDMSPWELSEKSHDEAWHEA